MTCLVSIDTEAIQALSASNIKGASLFFKGDMGGERNNLLDWPSLRGLWHDRDDKDDRDDRDDWDDWDKIMNRLENGFRLSFYNE
jgi:hypothetical protein